MHQTSRLSRLVLVDYQNPPPTSKVGDTFVGSEVILGGPLLFKGLFDLIDLGSGLVLGSYLGGLEYSAD